MTHPPSAHLMLATAGHIDHGKSALVRALTGSEPDRLPEEKARGITIDLGFSKLRLDRALGEPSAITVGVIDVPGHEDFIKNMIAGVGAVDAALLVVAADDGWMPQTEEHFQILMYLGVRQVIVALTKIDLAGDEAATIAAIRDRLAGTPAHDAMIVPTSIKTGRGVDDLRGAIANAAERLAPPRDYGKPRLCVDRAFALKGLGTIVTGTLIGGRLSRGDGVTIHPAGQPARVRSIQSHGQEVQQAVPGSRVALNLPDARVAAAHAGDRGSVRRGDVIASAAASPSRRLAVALTRTARDQLEPASYAASKSVENGTVAYLHHGASAVRARVKLIDGSTLNAGQSCLAILTLEKPVLAFARDRFVIRDESQRRTIAGGAVLDPLARSIRRRPDAYRDALARLAAHRDDVMLHLRAQLSKRPILRVDGVLQQTDFALDEVRAAIAAAVAQKIAAGCGPLFIEASFWNTLLEAARTLIRNHHQLHMEQAGMGVADIRTMLEKQFHSQLKEVGGLVVEHLVKTLGEEGFTCENGVVKSASHIAALPPRLRAAGERLRQRLAESALNPPSRAELCPTAVFEQAMRFLLIAGAAIELAPGVIVQAAAYAIATEKIGVHLGQKGSATVAELKELLGSSRRVVVPLLEKMDRDGLTRRVGDHRQLGPRYHAKGVLSG